MDLVVVGAGPSYSTLPGAVGASYLLVDDDDALLLDFGHGAFSNLANAWEPSTLVAIAISHLHPDHFIDLVALRHYLRYEFDPPRRARVLGPADLEARLDALHAESGWASTTLDFEAVGGPSSRVVGPFTIEAGLVTHTAESYAYRVTGRSAPSLVYSGDCGRAADLARMVQPGDLILSEASYGPGPVPPDALHLDGPAVGGVAADRGAAGVLLTHLHMGLDLEATIAAVRARFDGPVEIMRPGLRLPLGA
jgi:ribonuclease BN (tRNA processing enzyme)